MKKTDLTRTWRNKMEITEIERILKGRYFNRSAAIARITHIVRSCPQSEMIVKESGINPDIQIFYASNDELKNLLIELRILIERLENENTIYD